MPEIRPNPKVKVGSRMVTIGAYGALTSALTNVKKVAADIYNSGFTGIVLHIMGPWCQVPVRKKPDGSWDNRLRFPWPYDPDKGVFDPTKDNESYYGAFQEWLDVFEWYGLDLIICFDDIYYLNKWLKLTRARLHPYVQNKVKNIGEDKQYISDSINMGNPVTFDWLSWKTISDPENKFIFKLQAPWGPPRARWMGRIMDMVKAKRDASDLLKGPQQPGKKTWRIGTKRFNEEAAVADASGNSDHANSIGDRSEIYAWWHEQWEKRGLVHNGKNFFVFVNRDVFDDDVQSRRRSYTILHRDITAPYGQHYGMGAIHEVHIDGIENRQEFIDYCQFRPQNTFWSDDGMPKDSRAQFVRDSRALYLKGDPFFDQLFEEGGAVGKPNFWGPIKIGFPWQTQYNWDLVFPFHAAIVK